MSRSYERITTLDDPRVARYRNLKERTARGECIFVTEGHFVTQRLLDSPFEAESVFVYEEHLPIYLERVPPHVPLYVGDRELMHQIAGIKFHQGVLAAGKRKPDPKLEDVLPPPEKEGALRLVVCPHITKPENVGLVFRSAGAFGMDAVILGERSCDPFSRRALRVSMGATMMVPYYRAKRLIDELPDIARRWRIELVGTIVDPQAECIVDFAWSERTAVLMGHETDGLDETWQGVCHRCVTIPMAPEVDSLNLGVATGVFLYELNRSRLPSQAIENRRQAGTPA